jgi:hypothetical protein
VCCVARAADALKSSRSHPSVGENGRSIVFKWAKGTVTRLEYRPLNSSCAINKQSHS